MIFNYNNKTYDIISVSTGDHIMTMIGNGKTFYEIGLLEKIKSMNIDGTYVDIGANIGNDSIFFAHETNSERVVSFEISYQISNILRRNFMKNPSDKYKLMDIGLFSKTQKITLSPVDISNSGKTTIINKISGKTKVDTMDNLLKKYEDINLIKMDVEGAELDVLLGGLNVVNKNKPIIIAKLQNKIVFDDFNNILKQMGYTTDGISHAFTPTYIWKV